MKRTVGTIVMCVLFLAACTSTPTTEPDDGVSDEPIKIGFIGPLTGTAANLGLSSRHAVELAVEEVNADGGINGRPLEVVFEDGACDGVVAITGANKLMNVEKVPIIIGGLCSAETLSFADTAEQSGVVVLSYCSSSPDMTTAGDYIFRDYPSDSFQGKFAAEYLYEEGFRSVAVLSCLDAWCQALRDVFVEEFTSYGDTQIVAEEKYEKNALDLRSQFTIIEDADPEVLYWAGWKISSVAGMRQMKELGLDVMALGGDPWDDTEIPAEVGDAAEGHRYIRPVPASTEDLAEKMLAHGSEDVTTCTPQAYDALHIVANLMREGALTSDELRDALYVMPPYDGASGIIEFDENGDLKEMEFEVRTYEDGKIVSIEA